jgi:cysteine desulfurase
MATRRLVYLDHSATTPTDLRVLDVMLPYFSDIYGNALSAHQFGRKAEHAIETARMTIAKILNCKPSEIIFTSGGSESDNLAIRGAAWTAKQAGKGNHLITTPIEHSAIGKTIQQMAQVMGFEQTIVPVNQHGMVSCDDFAAAIRDNTTFASIMYVNNEVGTIQPMSELAAIAHKQGVLFHTDAVQAAGQLSLDVQKLGVDMLSISAHKFYGPKGVGALYVREGIDLLASQSGGSHEDGRRAGTHNTPLIVGMAKALELAYTEHAPRIAHYTQLRDKLITGILQRVPQAELSGHPEKRLPSHASFVLHGIDANQLLIHLDLKGVAASSASACKTGNPEPSGVLLALGYDREDALGSLRLSVGKDTTYEDVEYAIDTIAEAVQTMLKFKK